MVRMRKPKPRFVNNARVGSYVDISFEISSESHMGPESIQFETTIHYIEKGEGEPVLLVHGIGQSLYTWRDSINELAGHGYRVIAVDMAGFGYSGHPHIYYTVEENALIIGAVLDALKIKKTSIIGFSTGALSAICYAYEHPKRVDKLVLVSPGGPNENYPFSLKFLTTWAGHTMLRYLMNENSVRKLLYSQFFDTPLITTEVVDGYFAPYQDKEVRETLAMCMTHFDDTYARSLLKGTKHSVLVFSGAEDKMHDQKIIKAYAQNIPGARHIEVRNTGHFVHEEKPGRFASETAAFLRMSDAYQMFS